MQTATFTPTGGSLATLVDHANKLEGQLEDLGGECLVNTEPVYGGASVAKFPQGNVNGQCVFTAAKSQADYATAAAYFKAEYARLNGQGALVVTIGATTLTM